MFNVFLPSVEYVPGADPGFQVMGNAHKKIALKILEYFV
jgi:hypothetical protein